MYTSQFSPKLNEKIALLSEYKRVTDIGGVQFASPLIMAPMASITTAPFRLLMQDLGSGGVISELISSHGINYNNKKTLDMLKISPEETHTGIRLFGEDAEDLAKASLIAQKYSPLFIDLNMGCPVRKVAKKGAGSALLQDTSQLPSFFKTLRQATKIPLSIKIRTGENLESRNSKEISDIAHKAGINFLSIHGRTTVQKYEGLADWNYIEEVAKQSKIPVIGNGDLTHPWQIHEKLLSTNCSGLMIGRGALRNPFLFLESLAPQKEDTYFDASDYNEVSKRFYEYLSHFIDHERVRLIQFRKLVIWFASGFRNAAKLRKIIFTLKTEQEVLTTIEQYFKELDQEKKSLTGQEQVLVSGHG